MSRGAAAAALLLALLPAARAEEGATVFRQRCATCHSVVAGAAQGAGPNLAGLLGRVLGGDPGFDYSPVLEAARDSGQRWDAAALLQFLADPEEMFPGIWMGANGLRSEADRAAVVGFLARPGG